MPLDYDVSLSDCRNFVRVKVNQPMTNELGRRCSSAAVELANRTLVQRYLFDLRGAPNVETPLENYEFAYQHLADLGFPRNAPSALLTDPGDASHNFIETVFLNAGYDVKLFTDEAAAISWLHNYP